MCLSYFGLSFCHQNVKLLLHCNNNVIMKETFPKIPLQSVNVWLLLLILFLIHSSGKNMYWEPCLSITVCLQKYIITVGLEAQYIFNMLMKDLFSCLTVTSLSWNWLRAHTAPRCQQERPRSGRLSIMYFTSASPFFVGVGFRMVDGEFGIQEHQSYCHIIKKKYKFSIANH